MVTPEAAVAPPVVEGLAEVTAEDIEDFARLLPQLTGEDAPDTETIEAHLHAAANPANPDSRVFVIRDENGRIQASATGTICRIPTGEKAWVDDVVTDASCRGRGYGETLMDAMHGWFEERGAKSVNLTSTPARGAAGRLYERLGYEERPTRVYRRNTVGIAVVARATSEQ